jgi:hypothetical protein
MQYNIKAWGASARRYADEGDEGQMDGDANRINLPLLSGSQILHIAYQVIWYKKFERKH